MLIPPKNAWPPRLECSRALVLRGIHEEAAVHGQPEHRGSEGGGGRCPRAEALPDERPQVGYVLQAAGQVRGHGRPVDDPDEGAGGGEPVPEEAVRRRAAQRRPAAGVSRKKTVRPAHRRTLAQHAVHTKRTTIEHASRTIGISEPCYRHQGASRRGGRRGGVLVCAPHDHVSHAWIRAVFSVSAEREAVRVETQTSIPRVPGA